jgi:hypothetical protein
LRKIILLCVQERRSSRAQARKNLMATAGALSTFFTFLFVLYYMPRFSVKRDDYSNKDRVVAALHVLSLAMVSLEGKSGVQGSGLGVQGFRPSPQKHSSDPLHPFIVYSLTSMTSTNLPMNMHGCRTSFMTLSINDLGFRVQGWRFRVSNDHCRNFHLPVIPS